MALSVFAAMPAGADAENLLEKADHRMYESKKEAKRKRDSLRLAEAVGHAHPVDTALASTKQ
jgi:predicted signal transduction protein with EAL and GGDEF domain